MKPVTALPTLDVQCFESPTILRWLAAAGHRLVGPKGVAASIPHERILINTLVV